MEDEDAEAVASWRNRPDATRFLYQWPPLQPEQQLGWIRRVRTEGELLFMFDALDGEPVGTGCVCGFEGSAHGPARALGVPSIAL